MMPPSPPRVYLVTDPSAWDAIPRQATAALEGLPPGRVAVQLRARGVPARDILAMARSLRALTSAAGQWLGLNDRLDVALAVDADGVHLPAAGIPPREARRLLGPARLVAVSCHSAEDVAAARDGGADFATFGPIFATPSKLGHGPPVGLDRLREASVLGLPLVGLGGVDAGNGATVAAAGAWGLAAIRAWLGAADPGAVVRRMLAAVERGKG